MILDLEWMDIYITTRHTRFFFLFATYFCFVTQKDGQFLKEREREYQMDILFRLESRV